MSEKAGTRGPGGDRGYVLVDVDRDLVPLPHALESRKVAEQQVLRVRDWRVACATTKVPAEGEARVDSHLTLTVTGAPAEGSEASVAVLVFVPGSRELRGPSYDAGARRIMIEFPASSLATIRHVLETVDEVYVTYQAHENGQVWADLHTRLEPVGGQATS